MKIRMIRLAAGPMGVWPPGTEVELNDVFAVSLIQSGAAVPVVGVYERAVVVQTEVRNGNRLETDGRPGRRTRQPRRG